MKKSLLALTLLAALPFAASAAEGVSYNYVEGGYVKTNVDGPDSDGWALKGSVAVHPNFHLFGDYNRQKVDNINLKYNEWRVGVGYNHELSSRVDLLTRVAYEKTKIDSYRWGNVRIPGASVDGYSVEVGVNSALISNRLNGYALAGYENGDDYSSFYTRLGADVKFSPNWSATANVKVVKGGDNQWFVGPRFSW